jgi:hypothetical protein
MTAPLPNNSLVVTVSAGEISIVGYIPLMNSEVCLADYPEQMEAVQKEWNRHLMDTANRSTLAGLAGTLWQVADRCQR